MEVLLGGAYSNSHRRFGIAIGEAATVTGNNITLQEYNKLLENQRKHALAYDNKLYEISKLREELEKRYHKVNDLILEIDDTKNFLKQLGFNVDKNKQLFQILIILICKL